MILSANLETRRAGAEPSGAKAAQVGVAAWSCRLCGGLLIDRFSAEVLGRHLVRYLACEECLSLQTEPPYWLEEAYDRNLSSLDTGAVQRTILNFSATYVITRVYGARNLLDLGGGDGLLCRFLRDRGLNGFVRDRYASPTYAQGFDKPDFDCADLVTAFEVFEHLPEPRTDLHEFFSQRPPILLASTTQYTGQGPEWWYISPESGQHVFFYSRLALERVARDYGYRAEFCGDFILYVRLDKDIAWRRRVAFLLLKPRSLKLVAASLMLGPTTGAAADFALMRQRAARIQALAAARTDIRK